VKRRRAEWFTKTASGDLLASYQVAKQLQILAVPPVLGKPLAGFLLVVSAELVDRGVLEPVKVSAETAKS
jgi:hypothetical protein